MPDYPYLQASKTYRKVQDVFYGVNRNLKIGSGEFSDTTNLSSDHYPLLSVRRKRSTAASLTNGLALLSRNKLAYIDGSNLYYNSLNITSYLTAKGVAISTASTMLPKLMVSMGAYICIFPDKLFINTEDYTDCGSMEHSFSSTGSITYSMCKLDGTAYATPTVSPTAPTNPSNGDLWIDTSGSTHILKEYSSATETWNEIQTTYIKLESSGIGAGLNEYDGVTLSGCAGSSQITELNTSKIVYERGDNYIVVAGLLDQSYTQTTGTVKVTRSVPDMDFVTECENRLWGCKYGLVNGSTVNEIYCCALGDFRNWRQYLGLSTDSYAAAVGSDGPFTGAATIGGYPLFFKEGYLHKVYISSSGAHQITSSECKGVQAGCHGSMVAVGEYLYYKAREGVCVYDGSLPVSVSDSLGMDKYKNAVAGTVNDKYYLSMQDSSNAWQLFVYDTRRGFWLREDSTHAKCFARAGEELYYIDADTNKLMCVLGSVGTQESSVTWEAVSGSIAYETIGSKSYSMEHKYVSRVCLKLMLPKGSSCDFFMQYDDGKWEKCGHVQGSGFKPFIIPIRSRRCDHFRFKIRGAGEMQAYSVAYELEEGSEA